VSIRRESASPSGLCMDLTMNHAFSKNITLSTDAEGENKIKTTDSGEADRLDRQMERGVCCQM